MLLVVERYQLDATELLLVLSGGSLAVSNAANTHGDVAAAHAFVLLSSMTHHAVMEFRAVRVPAHEDHAAMFTHRLLL